MPPIQLLQTSRVARADPSDGRDLVEYALAILDLGGRRWSRALARLDALRDPALALTALPDRVEACVRLGARDEASAALERFDGWAAGTRSPWLQARRAGAHALLAHGDDAVGAYEDALRLAGDAFPFDRARIRLLLGEHLRRTRRRARARLELRAALACFETSHAGPWVERARAELCASGETARRRDPSTVDALTPQQLQIARLVAEGLSNKEVARRFFLSPRTVDNHLRNVFSKLGVTSRTQLAGVVLRESPAAAAATLKLAA
jgi:DNA-binding CsgD family transcriptional regulator